ncbi:PadR family transcriptional regulator [Micromonospora sp. NPDC050686]|uniref:PadR family transcriptional regulator n=1 Tax=Micromonospora sp. NPDC050686 TaxID=3154631 RepID=UPI0033C6848C
MADHPRSGAPELPATAYAVLGLLSFGRELTGYDLRKWSKNMRFFYWSPAQSQVYSELRRLLSHGYISERQEPQPGPQTKRYYRITDAGMTALRAWLGRDEVDPPVIKHSVMLRLFFGQQAEPDELRRTLRGYLCWLREQRTDLGEVGRGLLPAFQYPHLVAVWGQAYYAAETAAVEAVLAELDRLHPPTAED